MTDAINEIIDNAILEEAAQQTPRDYLGASIIGQECLRKIQFDYSNAPKDPGRGFSATLLRSFAIGHTLEDMAVKWFRDAGFNLKTRDSEGNQFGFITGHGKFAGHCDGVFLEAPDNIIDTPCLWECKTASAKKWNAAATKGLAKSHPQYLAQVAVYQAYLQLTENPAVLTMINKDTSELYHEAIPFNPRLAQKMSDRAVNIIRETEAGNLMPRVADDPDYFECRWCSYLDRCWGLPA
jgi:hypothetical protein